MQARLRKPIAVVLTLAAFTLQVPATTVTWDGGGDGETWSDPLNWDGNFVPTATNNVVISGVGGTVKHLNGATVILGLNCERDFELAGGSLLVTSGDSEIQGRFELAPRASLTARGPGVTFTARSTETLGHSKLYAREGALLSFPEVHSYVVPEPANTWHMLEANGAGSVLDLSGITNIDAGRDLLYVQAVSGGLLDLGNVDSVDGQIQMKADGSDSVVDVSKLQAHRGETSRLSVEARGGGRVSIDQLRNGSHLNLTLQADSYVPLTQLTNVDGAGLEALDGAVLDLSQIQSIACDDTVTWKAEGAGSFIDLSGVTHAVMEGYWDRIYVYARNGGTVDLSGLASKQAPFYAEASGTDSVVDLSGLSGLWDLPAGRFGYAQELWAKDDGRLDASNLTGLGRGTLGWSGSGQLILDALTSLDNTDLQVEGGAEVDLSHIPSIESDETVTWKAQGAGSRLNLSGLTNAIMEGLWNRVYVYARSGGVVDLSHYNGRQSPLYVEARGEDSLVDLSGLIGSWDLPAGVFGYGQELWAMEGGLIDAANLTGLGRGTLGWRGNGLMRLDSLVNLDNTFLNADAGAVVDLSHIGLIWSDQTITWSASGAGSVLNLSGLTNTVVDGFWERINVHARSGGTVDLSEFAGNEAPFYAEARGVDSRVDLSGVTGQWDIPPGKFGHRHELWAMDGGRLEVPNLTGLRRGLLGWHGAGQLMLDSLASLDNTALRAEAGAVADLSWIRHIQADETISWQANGANSILDLSGLTNLVVTGWELFAEARSGGLLDLGNVSSISGGFVSLLADGTESVINLQSLSSYINHEGQSKLEAHNGGVILLGEDAFLLANVDVRIQPGNAVLPPAVVVGPSLSLYGAPWKSYWVDTLDTSVPGSDWEFLMRVPLTNVVQQIGPPPSPDQAFHVQEFIADPAILELPIGTNGAQLILYGSPTNTFEIHSTTKFEIPDPWQTRETVTMTNPFRIFPLGPLEQPAEYFRAEEF